MEIFQTPSKELVKILNQKSRTIKNQMNPQTFGLLKLKK